VLRRTSGPKREDVPGHYKITQEEAPSSVLLIKDYSGDQIKHDRGGMGGGVCSTYGEKETSIQGFGGEPTKKEHLEALSINGRIILNWILRNWHGGIEWITLAQDRKSWRAAVNAVFRLRVP
jgi:hypothetical protein